MDVNNRWHMDIDVGQRSDKGLVRQENEDAFAWFTTKNGELFIVADGMGGIAGGKLAANTTVQFLKEYFDQNTGSILNLLQTAIEGANQKIRQLQIQSEPVSEMGTTIVALVIKDCLGYVAHIGDSRLYLLRNGCLTQLTRDHSIIQRMIDDGKILEEDAVNHPDAHIITRCIGADNVLEAAIRKDPVFCKKNDVFLLCSDGLSGLVRNNEISKIISQENHTPSEICQELTQLALERGGYDNITSQLIRINSISTNNQIQRSSSEQGAFSNQRSDITLKMDDSTLDLKKSKRIILSIIALLFIIFAAWIVFFYA
jgi:protein phosphatase